MDKAEVGPQIIDDILLDVVRALCDLYKMADTLAAVGSIGRSLSSGHDGSGVEVGHHRHSNPLDELHRTAKIFFEQLEPGYVWEHLANCFSSFEAKGYSPRVTSPASTMSSGSECASTVSRATSSPDELVSLSLDELTELTSFMLSFLPLVGEWASEKESFHVIPLF